MSTTTSQQIAPSNVCGREGEHSTYLRRRAWVGVVVVHNAVIAKPPIPQVRRFRTHEGKAVAIGLLHKLTTDPATFNGIFPSIMKVHDHGGGGGGGLGAVDGEAARFTGGRGDGFGITGDGDRRGGTGGIGSKMVGECGVDQVEEEEEEEEEGGA